MLHTKGAGGGDSTLVWVGMPGAPHGNGGLKNLFQNLDLKI